ncbi:ribosome recycling factor [Methylotetracoccus oryzae]|uniref:ribosome recycling factor n=1 Tax=Methylotetracoccus oryzae TaxID=1919059 RepID=UPI001118E18A|nr:ribosome recycling factor [Methylotetracoccus oryzae]
MVEDIAKRTRERMQKSIESLKHELAKIRTGRAHPSLLEHVKVDYYGSEVPISQVANVAIEDSRTLTVTPWEKTMVQAVDKAIRASDLGLNPATTGLVIRVPMPPLTEQRRKELIKVVRHEGEGGKVAIRNIRRDANAEIKAALKEKQISEDQERRVEEQIQKLTDQSIKEIDVLLDEKEADLMAI